MNMKEFFDLVHGKVRKSIDMKSPPLFLILLWKVLNPYMHEVQLYLYFLCIIGFNLWHFHNYVIKFISLILLSHKSFTKLLKNCRLFSYLIILRNFPLGNVQLISIFCLYFRHFKKHPNYSSVCTINNFLSIFHFVTTHFLIDILSISVVIIYWLIFKNVYSSFDMKAWVAIFFVYITREPHSVVYVYMKNTHIYISAKSFLECLEN